MAQKYLVGDIFMVDNQPRKVTWIGASYPRVEIDGVDVACKNSDLKPMPLTPEILEKNGWEFIGGQVDEDGFTWDIYSNGDVLPDLYYYPDGKFSVFMYRKEVLPDIEYIHQLQHFLFGLGLNSEMEV
jgi:hypothetical protein